MTGLSRSPKCAALASLGALALVSAGQASAREAHAPLPVYVEDSHAGTLQFLATELDLDGPHALVLVDAHSDASNPVAPDTMRRDLRRAGTAAERDARVRAWRREGAVQSFDWIVPVTPSPLAKVIWVRPDPAPGRGVSQLPNGFEETTLNGMEDHLPDGLPVLATIDLDWLASIPPAQQAARFQTVWERVVRLPRLDAISFAISRPWLADDSEASRLLALALEASLSLPQAAIRFEPWGIEGPDRSERAKEFYSKGRGPPRFDPETASPELRSLLLANAERLDVRLEPERWQDLLARWRAEAGEWRVVLESTDVGVDGVFRPGADATPDVRVVGGLPGRVQSVTWMKWTPKEWSYNVLPDLPAGKVFAGTAPPVVQYEATVLAQTDSTTLEGALWTRALPGPEQNGVLRVSAKVQTMDGVVHTARVEIRRGRGAGFRAGLSEQFGLPYVFGAGFLQARGLTGPETGVGNDCANFLVYAWRRSGLRIPWSNPAQLRRHLVTLAEGVKTGERPALPADALSRGLVVHLGSHVAALWEDRVPVGILGPEDLVVHHLGGAPEVLSLGALLASRSGSTFDLYLGPSREASGWLAVGGDVMPGSDSVPPPEIAATLHRADLAVANLETTVGGAGRPQQKRYVFQVPAERLSALRAAGISAVSLANNHVGDFGTDGLAATGKALDAGRIGHFGAGPDASHAAAAWYGSVKGNTVAFLSVSVTDPDLLPAGPRKPGMAVLPGHEREVANALATAREKARTVIVMPHWGREGVAAVTEEQRRWARWLVEHGADAVVGTGPHVVQTVEYVEGAPVFYSVGNLWFQGAWPPESRIAGVAFIGLDTRGRISASRLERVESANREHQPSGLPLH